MKVHHFTPQFPGSRTGWLRCKPNIMVSRAPHTDSEVDTPLGARLEIKGGTNHKVTCVNCDQRLII